MTLINLIFQAFKRGKSSYLKDFNSVYKHNQIIFYLSASNYKSEIITQFNLKSQD